MPGGDPSLMVRIPRASDDLSLYSVSIHWIICLLVWCHLVICTTGFIPIVITIIYHVLVGNHTNSMILWMQQVLPHRQLHPQVPILSIASNKVQILNEVQAEVKTAQDDGAKWHSLCEKMKAAGDSKAIKLQQQVETWKMKTQLCTWRIWTSNRRSRSFSPRTKPARMMGAGCLWQGYSICMGVFGMTYPMISKVTLRWYQGCVSYAIWNAESGLIPSGQLYVLPTKKKLPSKMRRKLKRS